MYPLLIVLMLASWLIQWRLRSKFKQYSQVGLSSGLSGAEIATKMLGDHGIYDVRIISTPGQLTDHYNPTDKTVNLSEGVYAERSAAAAAIAAHECGHAVQHTLRTRCCNSARRWCPRSAPYRGGYRCSFWRASF